MLSKKEIVFYYHRATARGICLTLLKDFDKDLKYSYSILPLVRPTESNHAAAKKLLEDGKQRLSAFRTFTESTMQRNASRVAEGQEAITRPGLGISTVNSNGEKTLFRPDAGPRSELENCIDKLGSSKRKLAAGKEVDPTKALERLKLDELQVIIREENIQLDVTTKKRRKIDLVNAILLARGVEKNVATTAVTITAPENVATTAVTINAQESNVVEKQVLRCRSTKELIEIARKEGATIPSGRKTKQTYVDAIYSNRHK